MRSGIVKNRMLANQRSSSRDLANEQQSLGMIRKSRRRVQSRNQDQENQIKILKIKSKYQASRPFGQENVMRLGNINNMHSSVSPTCVDSMPVDQLRKKLRESLQKYMCPPTLNPTHKLPKAHFTDRKVQPLLQDISIYKSARRHYESQVQIPQPSRHVDVLDNKVQVIFQRTLIQSIKLQLQRDRKLLQLVNVFPVQLAEILSNIDIADYKYLLKDLNQSIDNTLKEIKKQEGKTLAKKIRQVLQDRLPHKIENIRTNPAISRLLTHQGLDELIQKYQIMTADQVSPLDSKLICFRWLPPRHL